MDIREKISYDNPAMVQDDGFALQPMKTSDAEQASGATSSTAQYDVNRNDAIGNGDVISASGSSADRKASRDVSFSVDITSGVDVRKRDVKGPVQLLNTRPLQEASPPQQAVYNPESLDTFVRRKQGNDIKQLAKKKIRSFYRKQDELIVAFEDLSKMEETDDDDEADKISKRKRRVASIYARVTLTINTLLLIAKLVASILSGSMSIISSLVDSVVDLMSGLILWWAARAIKRRDPYDYPQGRTKLEPVSIIILSVVMGMASLQLLRESAQIIGTLASDDSNLPSMTIATFVIAGSTVGIKLVLWLVYRRVDSPIVQALAMDSRNDIMSNSVAIVCGYLGSSEFQEKFGIKPFVFADPVGAILISMYIIYNWWKTGKEQLQTLTGHTAEPDFISKVTWVALNHDSNITHLETVNAYHYGNNYIVKVDIVLPEWMVLRQAHDIGESLQQKLEKMEGVERAYVHVDYDFLHKASDEHKPV